MLYAQGAICCSTESICAFVIDVGKSYLGYYFGLQKWYIGQENRDPPVDHIEQQGDLFW